MSTPKKNLLIVDDDPSIRSSLKKALEQLGYAISVAADGLEASPHLKNVDLIILDLDMPRRDGWDVLEEIQWMNTAVPVIVLTGLWNELATYQIPGMTSLMSKPADMELLANEISRLLSGNTESDVPNNAAPGNSVLLTPKSWNVGSEPVKVNVSLKTADKAK